MFKLELFENELQRTSTGRELINVITQHMDEVMYLINHNREVIVVWKRNKGALFFADILGSGFTPNVTVKKQIADITILSLIRRMAVVLQDNGSIGLKRTIDKYFHTVITHVQTYDSLFQIFLKLRNNG